MKILVTRKLPGNAIELLSKKADIEIWGEDRPIPKENLLRMISGKDSLICLLTDSITKDVMDAAGNGLKIIANYAVGFNNIDIEQARTRDIAVTNTPGVLTDATADIAWALLFSAARRIVEADNYLRKGTWPGWDPNLMLGSDITGSTLGIIGAGRIGTAMAMKSRGFEMKVVYSDEHSNDVLEKNIGAKKLSLDDLLRVSDFISIHVPLTTSTRHLIGKRELNMMNPQAILINTSRGAVIDEAALALALEKGIIRASGLDVYEFEPEINKKLLKLKNAVLLPHIASATTRTRSKMADIAVENILAFMEGRPLPNRVI